MMIPNDAMARVAFLRQEISDLESQLKQYQEELIALEETIKNNSTSVIGETLTQGADDISVKLKNGSGASSICSNVNLSKRKWPLQLDEYKRYGRQMILDGFGLEGQLRLKRSHMLIVGAGGLGCPLLTYLAGAGIGHITIIDPDIVSISNLHRQVLHSIETLGINKAESAKRALYKLNPTIEINAVPLPFSPFTLSHPPLTTSPGSSSSLHLDLDFSQYDLVIDCTDNAPTRYLLNDVCVREGKTLLSGAAIRKEGWVVVWNRPNASPSSSSSKVTTPTNEQKPNQRGPCYRCVFPESPPNDLSNATLSGSGRCEDEGVLGPVTGVIGTLMAAEAIRILTRGNDETVSPSSLLLYSFETSSPSSPFRSIKLRPRKPNCAGCSHSLHQGQAGNKLQPPWWEIREEVEKRWRGVGVDVCGVQEREDEKGKRVGVKQLQPMIESSKSLLIDVRPSPEFSICSLPGFQNIPIKTLLRDPSIIFQSSSPTSFAEGWDDVSCRKVFVICRRGNDSLLASRAIQDWLLERERDRMDEQQGEEENKDKAITVKDVRGGLMRWARDVDGEFPMY